MLDAHDALDPKLAHEVAAWKHERPLIACRFDPPGRYVFVSAEDNRIQRFALADGAKTSLTAHESWVNAFAFSRDGQWTISGGCDGRLIWWETAAEQPTPVRTLDAHAGWIRALAVNSDGTLLASAGNDNLVKLWNVLDGTHVRDLAGHARHVYSLCFHPTQPNVLLSGDLAGVLKQWDVSAGTETRVFDAKALTSYNAGQGVDFGGVRALAVSPDGKYLAAGGLHNASNPLGAVHDPLSLLFEWEPQTLVKSLGTGDFKGSLWRQLFLSPTLLMAVSGGSGGGILSFWTPDNDKEFHRHSLPNIARDMDLHADGLRVCTTHFDGQVRLTRLAAKREG